MFKPLFFTAMFSLVTALAQLGAKSDASASQPHAAKPCPDGKHWDHGKQKCVGAAGA